MPSGVYRELADILGDAAVKKIWKRIFRRECDVLQRLFSKEYTKEFIKQHRKDMSASEIARTVGLSGKACQTDSERYVKSWGYKR